MQGHDLDLVETDWPHLLLDIRRNARECLLIGMFAERIRPSSHFRQSGDEATLKPMRFPVRSNHSAIPAPNHLPIPVDEAIEGLKLSVCLPKSRKCSEQG